MKTFLSAAKDFLGVNQKEKQKEQRDSMLRILKDFEQRAKDYKDSDPYLSGLNEGRAQMLQFVIEHIYR